MRIVTVKMPEPWIEEIDRLVREGIYTSRSELIREAVRRLLFESHDSSGEHITRKKERIRKTPWVTMINMPEIEMK